MPAQKGKMKYNNIITSELDNTNGAGTKRSTILKACLKVFGGAALATVLGWSYSSGAATFVPLGVGALPSGELVESFQFTLNPGESVPWHFHPGPLYGIIVSGTLTEDEGCGSDLNVFKAGSAFSERPGRVHRVFNFGTDPVTIVFTGIFPACYGNYNITLFVPDGPRCEGDSGKAHLEKIPACAP